jgi:2',3'-cyclic-nucleotide 2'-phosphodiesterase (5'-nucleotidase family)
LEYDAFTIGNHEFDRGVESFAENFIGTIFSSDGKIVPILSCNIDASEEPSIKGKFECSKG